MVKKIMNYKVWVTFLLLIFIFAYDYPSILFKRPQSVHHWRQADCASLALNYFQNGMSFFNPQTHNLTSNNKTSSFCAPSEIPFGYYFIASLYKVFGYNDFIYRFVNTLIFIIGLFYLFKTFRILLDDNFWAISGTLLFFTSPVLVYYGNNFLTDMSALAFTFIAWYFFFKYYLASNMRSLYLSILFFFIAASYKITALMSFSSLGVILIIELLKINKIGYKNNLLFKSPLKTIVSFVGVISLIGAWVIYAKNYNLKNATAYFSTTIFPIWEMDKEQINAVIQNIKGLWLNQYFHRYTLVFFAIIFVVNIFLIKKSNKVVAFNNIILFLFTIVYVILWFATFKDHDYYTINLYILLVFTLLNFLLILKSSYTQIFKSIIFKVLFAAFVMFNFNHARIQQHLRYYGWWNEYNEYKDYHTITPYLYSIGIHPLDTVICLPDDSHFTLYLMNQRGWTECMGNNLDSASISLSISKGANYLIINGEETIKRDYLKSFLSKPIGQYNSIKIYKIGN
ncbi:MAG: hypothetical protein A2X12_08025 [Bacteroidetes bacterium GWE2_29_8]|nr:MAG: hypothetical protein A2X12_08025 [Bacteroidetes bacterium GWE2_29_8]OFY22053.1 MAG: hypothetical protein A2X02_04395 [Bacteroidetes bacterium GWF2_29_10]